MKKLEKHSLFIEDVRLKWFASYFVILMLPLVISIFVFIQNGKVVDRQAKAIGNTALENVTKQFENWEDSCYSTLYNIINNQQIYEYMVSGDKEDNYEKMLVHNALFNYKKMGFSIEEILLYQPSEKWIISSDTSCKDQIYYEAMKTAGDYSGNFENWQNIFGGYYKGDFISIPALKGNKIFYISSQGQGSGGETFFNVVFSLDITKFQELINDFFLNDSANYLIWDQKGEIIYSYRQTDVQGRQMEGNINTDEFEEIKEQYTFFTYNDIFDQWTGAYIVPENVFYADNLLLRNSTLVSVLWCLALGAAMIWLFVKRNYRPLNHIIDNLLQQNHEEKADFHGNEYEFIDDSIQKVFKLKDKMTGQLDRQNKLMRTNILAQLLKRGSLRGLPAGESLEDYAIRFIGDRFCVAIFFIEDVTELFADSSDMTELEKTEIAKYIIDNVMTELTNEGTSGFMTEIDDVQVCIINLADDEEAAEALVTLIQKIRDGQKILRQYYDFSFTVAVSDFHQGYSGIKNAYTEALSAMEYRLLVGIGTIIPYCDIPKQEEETVYVLEDDQKLLNRIISGEYKKAEEEISALFATVQRQQSLQAGKLLVFDFSKVLYKAVRSVFSPEEQDERRLLIDNMLECDTLEEVQEKSLEIVRDICETVESRRDTKQNATIKKVIEYVNENYAEELLSVAYIADKFGLTPNYLSHIFKESTGEKFLDYIHKVRIENAKEILRTNTKDTVETIARQVGYNNISTFNRAFLKQEGLYPTKWAEKNRSANN